MTGRVTGLVERDRELGVLRDIVDRVAAGRSRLVLVRGDAGAGKTRLATELFASLSDRWRTVVVRASRGSTRPFGGLVGAVPAGELPEVAVGAALAESLRERAGRAPLAVLVDDAHSLDPMAIAALGVAVEVLQDAPVLIVATVRVGAHLPGSDAGEAITDLRGHPLVAEVRVPPLTASGIDELARIQGRTLDDATVAVILRRSGGNAFFVEELLHADASALPWTVNEAVMNRVAALPAPAQRVAEMLALADGRLPRTVTEAVDGSGGAGAAALVEAGLAVEERGDELVLRHGLVAEVVRSYLSGQRRQAAHAELAAGLADQAAVAAADVARHWYAGGDLEQAAAWARVAADEASDARAYRSASELYDIALSTPPADALDRAMVLDHAAVAAAWSGLTDVALARAREANRSYVEAGQGWRAAAMWLNPALSHVPKPPIDRSELAADAVPALVSDSEQASRDHRYDRAAELARRALRLAEAPDVPRSESIGWQIAAAQALIGAGHVTEGEGVLQRVRAVATADREWAVVSRSLTNLSTAALSRGEIAQAIALDHQALESGRRAESGTWLIQIGRALLAIWSGDLDGGQTIVDELLDASEPVTVEFAQLPAALIDLERGELASAERRLERMSAVETLSVASYTAGVLFARARWRYLTGDSIGAVASLVAAEDVTGDLFEPSRLERLMLKARSGWELGDREVLDQTHSDLLELDSLGGTGAVAAAALWVGGAIAHDEHGAASALGALKAAAESFEYASRYLLAADVWCDVADAAAESGEPELHDLAVRRATDLATERRLPLILDRISGSTVPVPAPAPATPSVFELLSPREREIAQLVALGRTNRDIGAELFISEHTVRNQLVKIFAKLGVARRTEIAALLNN